MLFLWGNDCVSENHAEKIIISTFVKNHFISFFIKHFLRISYTSTVFASFPSSFSPHQLLPFSSTSSLIHGSFYLFICTHTHKTTCYWIHLVLFVCKCVEVDYLELGLIREFVPGKNWFSPVRSYWLPVALQVGVVPFEIFPIYTGMTICEY